MTSRTLCALVAAVALIAGLAAAESDGRYGGEAEQIVDRIRLYLERHGVDGELTSQQMLERARWGYERWLDAEHRRLTKGADGAGWVSLGPANGAGRMTALAPHPTDDGTVLAGAASGGVWKTTDDGASWRPLTDGLSDLSVGALAYAPSDPDIVYLGSGEAGIGSFFVPGIGLLRSSDGGETWFLPRPDEVVAEQFFALTVDPRDPERLLAATERGLFETRDGGVSWELTLGHPDLYGVTEVLRSASDPERLWAALWCFSHCPEPLARVMTSSDGGASWSPAAGGLPDALLNNPNVNRIALAVAPSDDDVLYVALNTDRYTPQGPEVAIYRSADGGASWTETADPGVYLLGQGWYDNAITVDPTDPDTVVAAGVWYVRTSDGGASWTTMDPIAAGDWMGTDDLPHVDGHAFAWQGETLWLGCDGGVWTSDDDGASWTGRNEGLVTRQYYGLAIDPIRPDRLLGGTQDNKTNLRTGPGADDWQWVLDGDGFDCAINPLVPDLAYGTIYGTLVFRSWDGGSSWHEIFPPTGGDPRPFKTPLTMRAELPWQLYTGSSRVWRSSDGGSSWSALGTEVSDGNWSFQVVRSIALTPADHDRLMIGKGDAIYTTTDGGATWRMSPMAALVNGVALSPTDPALAVAGLARTADGSPPLLRTSDGGTTWHPAADGLPPFAVQVVAFYPLDDDVVFAGTDVGLYRSTDGGLSWTIVGDGLPAASVHDLRIAADGSRVVVATHGRGIWQLELATPPGEPPVVTLDGSAEAFIGDRVSFTATATDPDGGDLAVRWLASDDWRLIDGGDGQAAVISELRRSFAAAGEVLVGANAIDADGRMGFDSILVSVVEPGDDCSTPRVVPGAGPFPVTFLTENRATTVGPADPSVPCTVWPGDPDAGRWGSIWYEFTPAIDGRYIFTTCGSDPDTALSVWTGPACGPYHAVAGGCNDDDRFRTCRGRDIDSYLELELAAGDTARIMLGATGDNETGDVRFTVDCPTCGPPSPLTTELVAAAARVPGVGDSFWTSSLMLVNPTATTVDATVELLPDAGTAPAGADWRLDPGEAVAVDDVVGTLVGSTGAGALALHSTAPLAVASRTSTGDAAGSFGQGIPTIADSAVAADGDAVRLFGFADGSGFRTNLGLVNPGDDPIGLAIRFYNGETDKLAETAVDLAPGSWHQLNRVLEELEVAGEAVLAVIRQTTEAGRFAAYASVVDGATDDPTYLGETDVGRVGDPLWIPAAAHVTGIGGAEWRTDLAVCNPSTGDLNTRVALVGPDGIVDEITLHLPEGWVVTVADIVAERFGASGGGALRLDPNLGVVMATSRTYAESAQGTYGQGIPGVVESEFVTTGERVVLPGLRQDARFRTNVGFVNPSGKPVRVALAAHAVDGAPLGATEHTIAARSWLQLTQPLPRGTAYAGVTSTTPNASFFTYASVVDRATDDPTYIAAVPADDGV